MVAKRVLVTGGTGFLGRALIKYLVESQSGEIVIVKRHVDPGDNAARNIHVVFEDLTKPNFVSTLPERVDTVIHLAQSRRFREFPDGADDMRRVNVDATAALADWAVRAQVRRFVFTSTGNVYAPMKSPVDEDHVCAPRTFYAASKYAGELLLGTYGEFFRVDILRVFGLYGIAQREGVMRTILNRVFDGREITLAGGKGLEFTPIHITDAIRAVTAVLDLPEMEGMHVWNMCGPEATNLREIAEVFGRLVGRCPVLTMSAGEPMRLLGRGERLYAATGFRPEIALLDGLMSMAHARLGGYTGGTA